MPAKQGIVEELLALSRAELNDTVRQLLINNDEYTYEVWTQVRENPVLAAKVRGVLSGIVAQERGSRDEAMWTIRVTQAREGLAPSKSSSNVTVSSPTRQPRKKSNRPSANRGERRTNQSTVSQSAASQSAASHSAGPSSTVPPATMTQPAMPQPVEESDGHPQSQESEPAITQVTTKEGSRPMAPVPAVVFRPPGA